MDRIAATVADQEDTVVEAARMAVRDEGVGAFDAADQMVGNEQVENPIDAVRRDALAALLRHDVGDLIGARRLADLRDGVENLGTHVGPGLAGLFEAPCAARASEAPLASICLC